MGTEFCVGSTKCFWCGEMDSILIGKRPMSKDKCDSLQGIVTSYEPCQKCQEIMTQGFTFMEANEYPNSDGQPEIQKGVYPTGKMWVVRTEAVAEMGFDTSHGKAFISPDGAKKIGLYEIGQEQDD